jgi:hypothetical protein
MQKIGAQYVLKKISDTVMAPAPSAVEVEESIPDDRPAQITVHDGEGNVLGTAYRVDVPIYVITHGKGRPDAALIRSLEEPNGQVLIQRQGSKVAGLIYVPDPEARPQGEAVRAEDI